MQPHRNLRVVDRAFIQAVMFEQGILPMEKTSLDMRRALNQLPPDEARVLRRKFRKLWRRAMRDKEHSNPIGYVNLHARLGVGKHVPSRAERAARKQLVFDRLWVHHIEPLLRNFEAAGKVVGEIPAE